MQNFASNMKATRYYWFEGAMPEWLSNILLRVICRFRGHDPSPGPVVTMGNTELYQCWRCYETIAPPRVERR